MNPFERRKAIQDSFKGQRVDGKVIIDELCYCGHHRSEHFDSLALGHGECAVKHCRCQQYTWSSWVVA